MAGFAFDPARLMVPEKLRALYARLPHGQGFGGDSKHPLRQRTLQESIITGAALGSAEAVEPRPVSLSV